MRMNFQAVYEWKRRNDYLIVTWHSSEELLLAIRLRIDGWYDLNRSSYISENSMRLKRKEFFNKRSSLERLKGNLIAGERYDVRWWERWTTLKGWVMVRGLAMHCWNEKEDEHGLDENGWLKKVWNFLKKYLFCFVCYLMKKYLNL